MGFPGLTIYAFSKNQNLEDMATRTDPQTAGKK